MTQSLSMNGRAEENGKGEQKVEKPMMTFTVHPYPIYQYITQIPAESPHVKFLLDDMIQEECVPHPDLSSYRQQKQQFQERYGPRTITCQPHDIMQQHTLRFLHELVEYISHPFVLLNIMSDQGGQVGEDRSLHALLEAYRSLPRWIEQESYQHILDRTYRLTYTALPPHLFPPELARGFLQQEPYYHLIYALLIAPLALEDGSLYWAKQYVEEARFLIRNRYFPSFIATDSSHGIESCIEQTAYTLSMLHRILPLPFSSNSSPSPGSQEKAKAKAKAKEEEEEEER